VQKLSIDPKLKIAANLEATFEIDVSLLPLDSFEFTYSRRTGRIKNVFHDKQLVATLRTDGWLALTIYAANLLLQKCDFKKNCVTVRDDVAEFISDGKSVFCKHVVDCGNNVRAGSEVAVLDENGNVVGVGKAVLSAKMMKEFRRGVAVKIRESLKAGR
jgi:uncharacterized protein with predicted RNA binding PUA domain